jgi:hypothetical protein
MRPPPPLIRRPPLALPAAHPAPLTRLATGWVPEKSKVAVPDPSSKFHVAATLAGWPASSSISDGEAGSGGMSGSARSNTLTSSICPGQLSPRTPAHLPRPICRPRVGPLVHLPVC